MNNLVKKFLYYYKKYGIMLALKKVIKRIFHIQNKLSNGKQYEKWLETHVLTSEEMESQRNYKFEKTPLISIAVPMYNTKEVFFKELVRSLKTQTYSNWELCLADGSEKQNKDLEKYFEGNPKIKYKFLGENRGISANTNEALKMCAGEFIGFLDHDDLLSKDALFEIVKKINEDDEYDFIYSDEDKINDKYKRFDPYFKPDYAPETLYSNNYITHFAVVRKSLLETCGALDSKFNGAQDFDFVLRATNASRKVGHVSKILYHWRVHTSSTAMVVDAKPYAFEAGRRVAEQNLERLKTPGTVENSPEIPGMYKINYDIIGNPRVSIIIPNKDHISELKVCIDSIFEKTTYSNYEIIIVENGSTKSETFEYYNKIVENPKIQIFDYDTKREYLAVNVEEENEYLKYKRNDILQKAEFNYSSLINFGVRNVDGEFVLQLNNDTKVISEDWLDLMVGYAQHEKIGAVGGKLYFADKSIQHAGIIIGISGIAGNALVNLPYGKRAYYAMESATRNVSAVTGACLLCRRNLYEEVGFMDEDKFKVAFNDVDFCLKLIQKGYRNVYIPYVELYHYESKSRDYELTDEKKTRFENECISFKEKWGWYKDPYYNENFTMETCNFDLV